MQANHTIQGTQTKIKTYLIILINLFCRIILTNTFILFT